jgi:hypothetical protein
MGAPGSLCGGCPHQTRHPILFAKSLVDFRTFPHRIPAILIEFRHFTSEFGISHKALPRETLPSIWALNNHLALTFGVALMVIWREPPDGYVTTAQAALRTGYTTEQIVTLAKNGRLLGRHIGNRWFIYGLALDAFVTNGKSRRKRGRPAMTGLYWGAGPDGRNAMRKGGRTGASKRHPQSERRE